MVYALGIDVSKWQALMDWGKAASAGARFAFIRAGSSDGATGANYTDFQFERNAAEAPKKLLVGYYWFFRPEHNAISQAEYFCNLIAGKTAHLPAALDVEVNTKNLSVSIMGVRVKACLEEIERRTGRTPVVYTRASVWNPWLGKPAWAARFPLWVAHYTERPQPFLPSSWPAWTFWQWSADKNGRGPEFGAQSRDIDINRFAGDETALIKFAGLTPPVPAPTNGLSTRQRVARLEKEARARGWPV